MKLSTPVALATMPAEKSESRSAVRPVPQDIASITPVDLDDLRLAYGRLMTGYVAALGRSEQIERKRPGETVDPTEWLGGLSAVGGWLVGRSQGPLFPPLVRLLTGSHVRKQLRALAARCAQLGAAADPKRDGDLRDLLDEIHSRAEQTASFLPSPRLPSVFILIPFLIGLAAPLGSALNTGVSEYVWFLIVIGVSFTLWLFFLQLAAAYRQKRELFLPGASEIDRQPLDGQSKYAGANVYKDEDELFAFLGSGRRQEVELDRQAAILGSGVFFYGGVISAIVLPGPLLRWGVLGLAFILYLSFVRRIPLNLRVWR